jgi:hypothetical protein
MIQFPPVLFEVFRKFVEIFATLCLSPVSITKIVADVVDTQFHCTSDKKSPMATTPLIINRGNKNTGNIYH